MKKSRLLSIFPLLVAFTLTSCDLLNNLNLNGPRRRSSKEDEESQLSINDETQHTHIWGEWNVIKEATCTKDGQRSHECQICGEVKTETVKKLGHLWGEWVTNYAPTCQYPGSEVRHCGRCGLQEERQIPGTEHNYGDAIVINEPTCETDGLVQRVCVDCGSTTYESVPALGHIYATDDNGNDIINWTQEPTCTTPGYGTRTCLRCQLVDQVESSALGHDVQLVDGYNEPNPGEAKVRMYKCSHCNLTYLGFKASQVTDASRERLVFENNGNDEYGVRFWGRSIGNAQALDTDGVSINQTNNEIVYCSTEPGDYIEYAFTLTAAQAAELQTCRLYCDARPADYLNGTDFFAYGKSNLDWTPGYYIDGSEDHLEKDEQGNYVMVHDHAPAAGYGVAGLELDTVVKMGKRVEDYRYVLYVDNQVQTFDKNIKNPTHGSNTNMYREEFVLPFTFHLHEGLNKISLHMAGGYRSTFYNFTFRPYEEEEPVVTENVITEWDYDAIAACRTETSWPAEKTWDDNSKGFKFSKVDNGFTLQYASNEAMKARFQLFIAVKYSNMAKTGFWRQDEKEKTSIVVNGSVIEPPAVDIDFTNMTQSTVNDSGYLTYQLWFDIVDINLLEGLNEITVTLRYVSYSYFICGARLISIN